MGAVQMTKALLDDLVQQLGYRDARGFVDKFADPGIRAQAWDDLREKCDVTAAYFKGGVPVVAFFAADTHEQAMQAHRRLWNYGRVPILIATTADEVLAFSCNTAQTASRPDAAVMAKAGAHEQLTRVLGDFTRFSLESGRLARRHSHQLGTQNRVDQTLLRSLRSLRSRLLSAGVLATEIEPLLGRSIFVRYLEDRGILRREDLRKLGQPESLVAALTLGWDAVSSFFAAMSAHFSGDVFRSDALTRRIPDEALDVLAHFFYGADPETGQIPLWPYNFAIIPPEYISSIYEQLLAPQQKQDAAYYTPRRVVDLVLDELLPPRTLTSPTVLDPACGSGIFLTEAFRRLVHHRKTVANVTPSYDELSELLVGSIFGIDLNADAVGVTAFGLYLALLEHVDPRTIWLTARLPELVGKNLIVSDFFDDNALTARTFDVIAGNPPWKSQLTPAAARYLRTSKRRVPDRQIAVPFVWRAAQLLSPGGVIGLVLPSKTVLHNRGPAADRFRLEFFSRLNVRTLIDLSPLRKELFGAASPAVVAIFGTDIDDAGTHLLHVSPRRTPISDIVDGFVIPQQNIQRITRARAWTDPSIWKTLLWGSPQDVTLITHLRESFATLGAHVQAHGWKDGAGYQRVRNGDRNDASHLHGLPQIATSTLHAMQAPKDLLPAVTEQELHRPRGKEIYRAPHVLMRKGFRKTPEAAFVPYDATFTDGLSAIAAGRGDEPLLRAISGVLSSSLARYWYLMTSSSWGVEREQLHHHEWLSLPLPALDRATVATLGELAERAATGTPEQRWRHRLDEVVADAYGLTKAERQLVHDALDIRLSELQSGTKSTAYDPPVDRAFSDYTYALEAHLDNLELGSWRVNLVERTEGFARVTGTLVDSVEQPGPTNTHFTVGALLHEESSLLNEWLSSTTIIEPQAVILDGSSVHLVKPNRQSCWSISNAEQDAADIFGALAAGLQQGSDA